MDSRQQILSLTHFERLVAQRNVPQAIEFLFAMLSSIDDREGRLDRLDLDHISQLKDEDESALVFCTRFASAIGQLLTDAALPLRWDDYEKLLIHHRWIDLIFSLSGFRTSDSFLVRMGVRIGVGNNRIVIEGEHRFNMLLLFSLNSRFGLDFEQVYRADPRAASVAFLHYLSSRYIFSPRAFAFREQLLEWLPGRIPEMTMENRIMERMSHIYMHCSYAVTPRKHAIKVPLMQKIRQRCLEAGCVESQATIEERRGERPTIVVVAESFFSGHSVFRTHSRAVASLRERFHVAGLVHPNPIGSVVADLFDDLLPAGPGDFMQSVRGLAAEISARKPVMVFYLGVGMQAQAIALASLRLAPIQCVSFGHTATTMSPAMDYFILPEDFVGSETCFSEKVLGLPRETMPYARNLFTPVLRSPPDGIVRVAIPASNMKLNPILFDALARIAATAKTRMEYHFFPLGGTGLPFFELARVLRERLPSAKVFPQVQHPLYMQRLAQCDLFLCPFPYGNMNSIIDAFQLGMPGVCHDGPEAHAHADAAFFSRIGLPTRLVAESVEEYVATAVRLIDDTEWRTQCRRVVEQADLDDAFFPEMQDSSVRPLPIWSGRKGEQSLITAVVEHGVTRLPQTWVSALN